MSDIGNFQQSVGELSSSVGIIFSYIFASIFVILAIGTAVMAFIPTSSGSSDFDCSSDSDCSIYEETCQDKKCQSKKQQKLWLLFVSLLLLLMAVGIILYSRWYNKWVHKSRENAQIGGALAEIGMLSNLLNRN